MTAIHDFCATIRGWLAFGEDVYPDEVVTSWVRMTESALSGELRCKEMIQIDTGTLVDQRYLLPADWRELAFVRVIDGRPLRYAPKDDFYNPDFGEDAKKCYTLSGNYLMVGSNTADGTLVEITYYQDLPPLDNDPTWPSVKYPTLFTLRTLTVASMYSIEDERAVMWQQSSAALIEEINREHLLSKASGSRLTRRHLGKKGFG